MIKLYKHSAACDAEQEKPTDLRFVVGRRFSHAPDENCFRFLGADGVLIELWRDELREIGDHLGLDERVPIFEGFKRIYRWAREYRPDAWMTEHPDYA